jgi:hypothetical protein
VLLIPTRSANVERWRLNRFDRFFWRFGFEEGSNFGVGVGVEKSIFYLGGEGVLPGNYISKQKWY